jgi:hypothetical protein
LRFLRGPEAVEMRLVVRQRAPPLTQIAQVATAKDAANHPCDGLRPRCLYLSIAAESLPVFGKVRLSLPSVSHSRLKRATDTLSE